jgi:UPF0271 protein
MKRVDLNCDLGEYERASLRPGAPDDPAARDDALMARITSANIACGAHAGDDHVMRRTLRSAIQHHVAAGAHPGFADRASFGRTPLPVTPDDVYAVVTGQLRVLTAHAETVGTLLSHVKPHGALYNMAAADAHIAAAIAAAVRDCDARLLLIGLSGSALLAEAARAGLRTASEVFADRTYEQDGTLTPRTRPDAVISDAVLAADRVLRMVLDGRVQCRQGHDIDVFAETVCIHGDTATALELAGAVRGALERAGVRVVAPGEP